MRRTVDKAYRMLMIYQMLNDKQVVNLDHLANKFSVSKRTVQRDINEIKAFYADEVLWNGNYSEVQYDRDLDGYRIDDRKIPKTEQG